jgi:4-aminobutyrate aminotransferase-like enzyme
MRNELNTFKTLFEQVRGLGIVMQLPNRQHTSISEHLNVWFDEDYKVTSVAFGTKYDEQVEITKYSVRENRYKISIPIDITDKELNELIQIVNEEYRVAKVNYLKLELATLEGETV